MKYNDALMIVQSIIKKLNSTSVEAFGGVRHFQN